MFGGAKLVSFRRQSCVQERGRARGRELHGTGLRVVADHAGSKTIAAVSYRVAGRTVEFGA